MVAIEMRDVAKRFGGVTALDGVELTVKQGEVFGFLGPNGAGKSTSINVLLDFVRADAGHIEVLGHDVATESVAVRERTGVLPEGFDGYSRLTAREHIIFAAESKGVYSDPEAMLERVGLSDAVNRRAGGFSKGMAQRLALAMALVGEPDLLVLDEPSTGLDPNGAREMRDIVREEQQRGATVFFSSHVLGQVESVCDRVGILRDGEVVAVDSIQGLRAKSGSDTTLEIQLETPDTLEESVLTTVRAVEGVSEVRTESTGLTVACEGDVKMAVLDALESADANVVDFSTREASLEDLFAAYTEGTA